jgi:hypothetical protein
MPNANDAELTDLYAAATGLDVADDEPNTGPPGGPAATNFDVHIEAVAGNVIGTSGSPYTMVLTCIDETLGAPNAGMSRTVTQSFNTANGWLAGGGTVGNLRKEQTFNIAVPAGVRGHIFRYVGSLVSDNNEVVSFIESNRFVLV